jgi:hypothetical protein
MKYMCQGVVLKLLYVNYGLFDQAVTFEAMVYLLVSISQMDSFCRQRL